MVQQRHAQGLSLPRSLSNVVMSSCRSVVVSSTPRVVRRQCSVSSLRLRCRSKSASDKPLTPMASSSADFARLSAAMS